MILNFIKIAMSQKLHQTTKPVLLDNKLHNLNFMPTQTKYLLIYLFQVWFKNRRAKWRKRERNQMNAIAAADFKNGFGPQFVQPFADTDTLYSSYTYNNWAKVPSPLGAKTFPWTVNPLGTSIVSTNHHQNSINCFNTSASSVAAGMAGTGTMLPASMGTGLTGTSGATGVSPTPCPYTTPTNPYMYHHRAAAEPCTAMSSSIATLRLKAKQHTSGFSSPYSASSPVSRSNSAGLCRRTSMAQWDGDDNGRRQGNSGGGVARNKKANSTSLKPPTRLLPIHGVSDVEIVNRQIKVRYN
uniref:OAR domain-containing protein n=1 Tax=Anopheles maculatus TaxID=74869 RepID=A0A182SUV7_9DIPT